MATFKATVRGVRTDGFMQVYIRVSHHKRHGYIKTDKMVTRKELNKQGEIKDPFVLNYCTERIMAFNERLNRKDISKWSVAEVVEFLKNGDEDICFSDYARTHIDRLIDNNQERTSRNYKLALQHMERFFGTNRIMFGQLTSMQVGRWIKSLEQTRRAKEMYPVCMRQVFRAAIAEFNDYDNAIIRIKTNPWGKVKIPPADRSEKIAISPEECRAFFAAPLPATRMIDPLPELGRDVAMLVLCLAGMNTADIYELKKENYHDGVIGYKRAKTRKSRRDDAYIEMRVEPIIEPIIKKYLADEDDPYLLNFHKRYCDFDSFGANVNNGIRQVCKSMNIPKEKWYCVYTFRHTWGTIAQNDCGASIAEVAFGMNHSHGHTITRGYIKIDFTPAWELNAKVIDFIFFSTAKSKQGMARGVDEPADKLFRLSPKRMVYARAYFRGEVLAEVSDIGFGTVDEVIARLAGQLPDTIPTGCAVQFRIKDVDADREAVYERTKGKGF
ncbi:transposase [Muribaculaceae bacterium Isolate-039 (Harlan)]|nr:transposase [Muribaculaceae bacterium Isolate-039 (Harlan)]